MSNIANLYQRLVRLLTGEREPQPPQSSDSLPDGSIKPPASGQALESLVGIALPLSPAQFRKDRQEAKELLRKGLSDEEEEPAPLVTAPLSGRMERARTLVLEDERVTDGLDAAAARSLLDWGLTVAETLVVGTVGLSDQEAEETIDQELDQLRVLLRQVNRWVPSRSDLTAEENASLLDEIIRQTAAVHGPGYSPPDPEQRAAFLENELNSDAPQMITALQALVEGAENT